MAKGYSMKWKKFCELQAKYEFLGHDLNQREDLRNMKEFVRTKVNYIAFRPFESLDLSTGSSSGTSGASAVEYQLVFHVEGEYDNARLRDVTAHIGDGSIQAHIDDVMVWFEANEDFRGKQLVWERVVRRTVRGSSNTGLTSMSLEIYLFPRFYRFRPIPRKPLRRASASTIAYLSGEPLPPIIPGTTRFAGDFD